MTTFRVIAMSLGSILVPGLGQGAAGRKGAMLAWAIGVQVLLASIVFSIWLLVALLVVRLAGAIDAFVRLRRASAVNRELALIAFAITVVGIAFSAVFLSAHKLPSSSMNPTLEVGDHVIVEKLTKHLSAIGRGDVVLFDQPCQVRVQYLKRVIALGGDTVEVRCNVVYVNGAAIPNELVEAEASYQDHDEEGGQWYRRDCSRYRERHGGHTYEVFHDRERPQRDQQLRDGKLDLGDQKDFPGDGPPPGCSSQGYGSRPSSASSQPAGTTVETKPGAAPCEPQRHFQVPAGTVFVLGDNRNNSNDSRYWGVVPLDLVHGRVLGIWSPLGRLGKVE